MPRTPAQAFALVTGLLKVVALQSPSAAHAPPAGSAAAGVHCATSPKPELTLTPSALLSSVTPPKTTEAAPVSGETSTAMELA